MTDQNFGNNFEGQLPTNYQAEEKYWPILGLDFGGYLLTKPQAESVEVDHWPECRKYIRKVFTYRVLSNFSEAY